jgi:hypothetical protein
MPFLLLQLNSRPFVVLNGLNAPVSWNSGLFLKIRRQTSHMLVTGNAITYFRHDKLNDLLSNGWSNVTCFQNDNSLCLHSPELDMFNSETVQKPYLYPDSVTQQYPLVKDVCLKNSGSMIVNSSMYTVSMCDLIDARAQFVLVEQPDNRRMFYRTDSTSLVEYACLACVCLYAVATLARHAVLLVKANEVHDNDTKVANPILQFIPHTLRKYCQVCVLHIGLSLFLLVSVILDLPNIATQSEYLLAWYLNVYVLWDCVFCVWKMSVHERKELKQINVMVVLLIMCCLRLYHTFQNAFHVLLVVIFAIRTSCKVLLVMLLNSDRVQSTNKLLSCNVSLVYDVLTLYLLLLCLNFTTESVFDSQLMNSTILLIGFQLGTVVAFIHKCKCHG